MFGVIVHIFAESVGICKFPAGRSLYKAIAMEAGADPLETIGGKKPIDLRIEMYSRSDRFADCLQVMLNPGDCANSTPVEEVLRCGCALSAPTLPCTASLYSMYAPGIKIIAGT